MDNMIPFNAKMQNSPKKTPNYQSLRREHHIKSDYNGFGSGSGGDSKKDKDIPYQYTTNYVEESSIFNTLNGVNGVLENMIPIHESELAYGQYFILCFFENDTMSASKNNNFLFSDCDSIYLLHKNTNCIERVRIESSFADLIRRKQVKELLSKKIFTEINVNKNGMNIVGQKLSTNLKFAYLHEWEVKSCFPFGVCRLVPKRGRLIDNDGDNKKFLQFKGKLDMFTAAAEMEQEEMSLFDAPKWQKPKEDVRVFIVGPVVMKSVYNSTHTKQFIIVEETFTQEDSDAIMMMPPPPPPPLPLYPYRKPQHNSSLKLHPSITTTTTTTTTRVEFTPKYQVYSLDFTHELIKQLYFIMNQKFLQNFPENYHYLFGDYVIEVKYLSSIGFFDITSVQIVDLLKTPFARKTLRNYAFVSGRKRERKDVYQRVKKKTLNPAQKKSSVVVDTTTTTTTATATAAAAAAPTITTPPHRHDNHQPFKKKKKMMMMMMPPPPLLPLNPAYKSSVVDTTTNTAATTIITPPHHRRDAKQSHRLYMENVFDMLNVENVMGNMMPISEEELMDGNYLMMYKLNDISSTSSVYLMYEDTYCIMRVKIGRNLSKIINGTMRNILDRNIWPIIHIEDGSINLIAPSCLSFYTYDDCYDWEVQSCFPFGICQMICKVKTMMLKEQAAIRKPRDESGRERRNMLLPQQHLYHHGLNSFTQKIEMFKTNNEHQQEKEEEFKTPELLIHNSDCKVYIVGPIVKNNRIHLIVVKEEKDKRFLVPKKKRDNYRVFLTNPRTNQLHSMLCKKKINDIFARNYYYYLFGDKVIEITYNNNKKSQYSFDEDSIKIMDITNTPFYDKTLIDNLFV